MRRLIILWLILMLQHSTNAQFSECRSATCSDGMLVTTIAILAE